MPAGTDFVRRREYEIVYLVRRAAAVEKQEAFALAKASWRGWVQAR